LLGIDPGLANTGWAVIDSASHIVAAGTIRTRPGSTAPRLQQIVTELRTVVDASPVGEAALEELFMGRNATSVIGVAQARGAILAALAAAGVPVFEYKPAQVKVVLTGYGKADKQQLARVVALQATGGGTMDNHATDAAAIALCHARSRRLRTLTGR
jgi:crossover junction endodeoxyribonuclease RuvC